MDQMFEEKDYHNEHGNNIKIEAKWETQFGPHGKPVLNVNGKESKVPIEWFGRAFDLHHLYPDDPFQTMWYLKTITVMVLSCIGLS